MAREPHRSSEILDAVALLVVDMQDAFLNVMPDRDGVLRRTALAIEAARAFGIKVVFTEQVPSKLGHTNADLLALAPEARVFAKAEFSALLAEGLQEYLRKINVYHLLIAGLETPICVYQTALHAQDHELDVTILSDCTTGRRPEDCIIVLEALARAECHVLPAETVFYSMIGSSLNPRFPHFTRIVKRYSGEDPIGGGPTPAPEPEHRPDTHDRHSGGRHGDHHERRDRQQSGRRSEQSQPRPQPQSEFDDAPAGSSVEDTDDLRAEDGISDEEANQPSYEEATSEHSGDESPAEEKRPTRPSRSRAPAPSVREQPAASESEGGREDSDTEAKGDDSADQTSDSGDASGDSPATKKRPRRRRGGARRRRARERAAGTENGASAEGSSAPTSDSGPGESAAPSPVSEAPPAD